MGAAVNGNLLLPKTIEYYRGSEAKNHSLHTPLKPCSFWASKKIKSHRRGCNGFTYKRKLKKGTKCKTGRRKPSYIKAHLFANVGICKLKNQIKQLKDNSWLTPINLGGARF